VACQASTVSALCPSHSCILAGEQLPLEARTQGIYAELLLGLRYLLLTRAGVKHLLFRPMMAASLFILTLTMLSAPGRGLSSMGCVPC
jgi:hypothetical protein